MVQKIFIGHQDPAYSLLSMVIHACSLPPAPPGKPLHGASGFKMFSPNKRVTPKYQGLFSSCRNYSDH